MKKAVAFVRAQGGDLVSYLSKHRGPEGQMYTIQPWLGRGKWEDIEEREDGADLSDVQKACLPGVMVRLVGC